MALLHVPRNNYTCFISNAKIYRVTARRQDLRRRGLVHVGTRLPLRLTPHQDLGVIDYGAETCFLGAKSHGAEVMVYKRKSNHQGSICEYFSKKGLKNKKFGVAESDGGDVDQ